MCDNRSGPSRGNGDSVDLAHKIKQTTGSGTKSPFDTHRGEQRDNSVKGNTSGMGELKYPDPLTH